MAVVVVNINALYLIDPSLVLLTSRYLKRPELLGTSYRRAFFFFNCPNLLQMYNCYWNFGHYARSVKKRETNSNWGWKSCLLSWAYTQNNSFKERRWKYCFFFYMSCHQRISIFCWYGPRYSIETLPAHKVDTLVMKA